MERNNESIKESIKELTIILKELKLTSGVILIEGHNNNFFSVEYSLKTFGNKYSIKIDDITGKTKAHKILNNCNLNRLRHISHDLRSVSGIVSNGKYLFGTSDVIERLKKNNQEKEQIILDIIEEIDDYDGLIDNGLEELSKVIKDVEKTKVEVSGKEISIYYMLENFFPNHISTLVLDDSLKININFNLELFNKIQGALTTSSSEIICRISEKKYLDIIDISKKKIIQRFRLE